MLVLFVMRVAVTIAILPLRLGARWFPALAAFAQLRGSFARSFDLANDALQALPELGLVAQQFLHLPLRC